LGEIAGCVSVRELDAHARSAHCVGAGAVGPDDSAFNIVRFALVRELEAELEKGPLAARGVGLDEESASA
jgi:hypothetical protein